LFILYSIYSRIVSKKIDLLEKNLEENYRDRIVLKHINAVEGNKFAECINNFYQKLEEEILIEKT